MRRILSLLLFAGVWPAPAQGRIEIVWPTPSRAFEEGRAIDAFIQHAGSGDVTSGCFGGVRSGGRQFHEGIDIRPVARDRRGEATDPVFAAMDGVVAHVATVAGNSNYGRYVVLEHPEASPAVYTLYAHLARVEAGLRPGVRVKRGQVLGVMGRSSSSGIPPDRAHLHFEIGLRITENFQAWFDGQKFGSPNRHGLYNGMNLMGFDPLDFLRQYRAGKIGTFDQYLAALQPAVRARIATVRTPDFIRRYPSLLTKPSPLLVAGWEISFDWTGLPFKWTPLTPAEAAGLPPGQIRIVEVNAGIERRERSKTLAVWRRGEWAPGKDLLPVVQQLFGNR